MLSAPISLSKKVALWRPFLLYLRTGDEDAEERSGAAAGGRNAVHGYAGTQGTPAAEDRRSGEFRAHLRIGRRFILRG